MPLFRGEAVIAKGLTRIAFREGRDLAVVKFGIIHAGKSGGGFAYAVFGKRPIYRERDIQVIGAPLGNEAVGSLQLRLVR